MCDGLTFRKRIPNRGKKETGTPEAQAVIQRPTGMNRKKTTSRMKPMKIRANTTPRLSMESSTSTSLRSVGVGRGRPLRLDQRPHHVPVSVALHHLDSAALRDV